MFKLSLLPKLAAILAGGGVLAFGTGFFVGQVRGAYADGRDAGRTESALAQRDAAETIRHEAEARIAESESRLAKELQKSDAALGAARADFARRLGRMGTENADIGECLALPLPPDFDDGLRPQAAPAGDNNSSGA